MTLTATTARTGARHPFFTYGTLRPLGLLSNVWRERRAVAALDGDVFVDGYRLVFAEPHCSFPYAIPAPGERLIGSLVSCNNDEYAALVDDFDRIEGYPHHYDRLLVDVHLNLSNPTWFHQAWLYVPRQHVVVALGLDRGTAVPGNDWYRRGEASLPECPECGSRDRGLLQWPCDDGPNAFHLESGFTTTAGVRS